MTLCGVRNNNNNHMQFQSLIRSGQKWQKGHCWNDVNAYERNKGAYR